MASEPYTAFNRVQRTIDTAIRSMGGYWPPLASLARVLEELGEMAAALEGKLNHELFQEAADCVVASVALANQYGVDLASASIGPIVDGNAMHRVLVHAGQIARAVNRIEGNKPPKPGEGANLLPNEFAGLLHHLARISGRALDELLTLAAKTVKNNATRDANRFIPRTDPITASLRDEFIAFALENGARSGPQLGIWGDTATTDLVAPSSDAVRFLRLDTVSPLAALVIQQHNLSDCSLAALADLGCAARQGLDRAAMPDIALGVVGDQSTGRCFVLLLGSRALPDLRESLMMVRV